MYHKLRALGLVRKDALTLHWAQVVVCPYLTLTNATAGPLTGKLGLYVLLCKCTCSTGEAVRIVLPKTLLRALARQGPVRTVRSLSCTLLSRTGPMYVVDERKRVGARCVKYLHEPHIQ